MSLDPELQEMRRLGHMAVDLAVEHLAGLRDRRVVTPPRAAELQPLVAEPLPAQGCGVASSLDRFFTDLLPRATLVNHPRFFAYIPGPGSFAGAVGEWLAAAANPFVGTWLGGAVLAQLEVQTLDWLRQATGLPEPFTGLVTTGGSMANLGGLAAGIGRIDRRLAIAYVSEQSHYSLAKAAQLLGLHPHHIRQVPVDDELRMDVAALQEMVAIDQLAGLRPAVVCATAGTTNTGAVDPLAEMAALCAREELWLHVDAAYGGAVALLPEGRQWLSGWERADSIALDPHKWLYAPFECGVLLTRQVEKLKVAFGGDGHYMQDVPKDEVNFFTLGPELTRGARALKLWMLLRSCGTDAIAAAIRHDLELCRLACELLSEDPRVEIITPPRLSIFTFAVEGGDAAGKRLVERVMEDGFLMLSSTRLFERYAVRFCVANHRTTTADVRESVARIRALI